MYMKRLLAGIVVVLALVLSFYVGAQTPAGPARKESGKVDTVTKSDEEWKKELAPDVYAVTREKATERPFTGKYWNLNDKGVYSCACCGQELFTSDTKFDAGCGWPSFWNAVDDGRIRTADDISHGMVRTEIMCARCGAHLGHLFDDGPEPTGKRYCVNSASLEFHAAGKK